MITVEPKDTSTERLLAVAALLEERPDLWEQRSWSQAYSNPLRVATEHTCGTYGCMAGWGVAMTPAHQLEEVRITEWDDAGQVAFGFDFHLAQVIFSSNYKPQAGPSPLLRLLAEIPEQERTLKKSLRRLLDGAGSGIKDLSEADITGVDLSGLNLTDVNFGHSTMFKVNLSGANLARANLGDANLARANLDGANLRRAHLWGTDFTRASLRGANMSDAVLGRANFTGADLTGADIDIEKATAYLAIFTGATLP